jgi:hypothetical protein
MAHTSLACLGGQGRVRDAGHGQTAHGPSGGFSLHVDVAVPARRRDDVIIVPAVSHAEAKEKFLAGGRRRTLHADRQAAQVAGLPRPREGPAGLPVNRYLKWAFVEAANAITLISLAPAPLRGARARYARSPARSRRLATAATSSAASTGFGTWR